MQGFCTVLTNKRQRISTYFSTRTLHSSIFVTLSLNPDVFFPEPDKFSQMRTGFKNYKADPPHNLLIEI